MSEDIPNAIPDFLIKRLVKRVEKTERGLVKVIQYRNSNGPPVWEVFEDGRIYFVGVDGSRAASTFSLATLEEYVRTKPEWTKQEIYVGRDTRFPA